MVRGADDATFRSESLSGFDPLLAKRVSALEAGLAELAMANSELKAERDALRLELERLGERERRNLPSAPGLSNPTPVLETPLTAQEYGALV